MSQDRDDDFTSGHTIRVSEDRREFLDSSLLQPRVEVDLREMGRRLRAGPKTRLPPFVPQLSECGVEHGGVCSPERRINLLLFLSTGLGRTPVPCEFTPSVTLFRNIRDFTTSVQSLLHTHRYIGFSFNERL